MKNVLSLQLTFIKLVQENDIKKQARELVWQENIWNDNKYLLYIDLLYTVPYMFQFLHSCSLLVHHRHLSLQVP